MTNSLVQAVNDLIRANPDQTEQARKRPELAGWFIGQIMKATNGDYTRAEIVYVLAARGICGGAANGKSDLATEICDAIRLLDANGYRVMFKEQSAKTLGASLEEIKQIIAATVAKYPSIERLAPDLIEAAEASYEMGWADAVSSSSNALPTRSATI